MTKPNEPPFSIFLTILQVIVIAVLMVFFFLLSKCLG